MARTRFASTAVNQRPSMSPHHQIPRLALIHPESRVARLQRVKPKWLASGLTAGVADGVANGKTVGSGTWAVEAKRVRAVGA